jgi:hypothetical protein
LTGARGYASAPGSFIFSLRNKQDLAPFKAPLKSENAWQAIYRSSAYGPTFGKDHDLKIAGDAASNTNSFTNLGQTYQLPLGYNQTNTRYYFTPSEIEVLYLD